MTALAEILLGWLAVNWSLWMLLTWRRLPFREFLRAALDATAIAAFAGMILLWAASA